jgi:hypothetical protein
VKVCGVELSGNDAIVSLLMFEQEVFHIPECRVRRISCKDPDDTSELRYFQVTFAKLVEDYQIDKVVIRQRMKKGKFAGGANSFKLEAAIQLMPEGEQKVVLMSATEIKAALKHYPMPMRFEETGLKKFQESAFTTAFAYIGGQYEWS